MIQIKSKIQKSNIETTEPDVRLGGCGLRENQIALIKKFLKFLGIWSPLKVVFFALRSVWRDIIYTPQRLSCLYSRDYYKRCHYSTQDPREAAIKGAQAEFIRRALHPKKVLVAGCAAGELVRALRQKDIEAWGFDVTPDLKEVAYPDVGEYLRMGSLHHIPFGVEDGFDVLVAFDVFEHVPLRDVGAMVEDIVRLSPEYLVTIIAHAFDDAGHLTLMPLSWWRRKFAKAYELIPVSVDTHGIAKVYSIDDSNSPIRVWRRRHD